MKQRTRSNALTLLSLLSLLALNSAAPLDARAQGQQSQQPQQRGRSPRTQGRRGGPTPETKDAQAARRQQAVNLLRETADEARTFNDLFYRARIQTLAADALWEFEQERARLIFRRAWEAATASDKAEQEEIERQNGAAGGAAKVSISEARDEVLLKAATRDPSLAEAFLKELSKEKTEDKSGPQSQTTARTPWRSLSGIDAERLAFAFDLLDRGESNSAAQLATPLVSRGASADLMAFIIRLRERNAAASDRLYGLLLAQARTDASADANSVLLLSSPMISPELLVVVDERGSLQFRPLPQTGAPETEAPPIPVAVRSAFYQTAAVLLLRPIAPRSSSSSSSSDNSGQTQQQALALYLAMGRLLPFFEREAAQYAPELRAREQALASELEQGRRDMLASHFELQRVTPERGGDPLRASFEQLARAGSAAERDSLRLSIVRTATRNRLWDRARRSANEIEDTDSRRAALSFVAVSQIADLAHAYADTKETDYESIVKFLQNADVPPLASAWGYAEAANIAARAGDARAALGLLDEAERFAARVEARTRQRVAAYAIVADTAARLDKQRAWTLLYEVVKAANAVEDFAGDEVALDIMARDASTPEAADHFSVTSETFRLDKIFATMAHLDWTKTLTDARALEGDVPQAFVYIAIARAALDKKQG
ncbi:MAG TPA: hypothetical protein VF553_11070 [Pyrinomonadaceae bacterium]|jgi:hypothetical protein